MERNNKKLGAFDRIKGFLPYLGVAFFAAGVSTALYLKYTSDLDQIKAGYIEEEEVKADVIAQKVEFTFKEFYQGLRTMTFLPGVRQMDRYGKNFTGDSKSAMQQIYNNTYLNLTLSEVYRLPKTLDPDKIDPVTQEAEAPNMTFDEFIIGPKVEEGEGEAKKPELEEVEVFEYRLEKTQLEYLAAKYPTNKSFHDIEVPAITGPNVVTCDNSEFHKEDLASGNDKPRVGLLMTLPVYDMDGNFSGGITGVVRTTVIAKLVPEGMASIVNLTNHFVGEVNPGTALEQSKAFFKTGKKNPNLIMSQIKVLKINDTSEWQLWYALDDTLFYSLNQVGQAKTIFWSGIFVTLLISGIVSFVIRSSLAYQETLERKIELKTAELSLRNKDMKLILDNAEQGFINVGLDGNLVGDQSSVVIKWLGEAQGQTKIWDYLFPESSKLSGIYRMGWDQIIEDIFPFEISADQMIQRFKLRESTFSIQLRAVMDGNKLFRILVVVSNITEKILAEQKEVHQRELVNVFRYMMADKSALFEFFDDNSKRIKEIVETPQMDHNVQFRAVHTIKGNSAQYGLESFAGICHNLESKLVDGQDNLTSEDLKLVSEDWTAVQTRFEPILNRKKEESQIHVDGTDYAQALKLAAEKSDHVAIVDVLASWKLPPVRNRLKRLANMSESLAVRLGKGEIETYIDDNGLRMDDSILSEFWAVMVHVVRNAVDHGFENYQDRTKGGRPTAKIEFTAHTTSSEMVISVRDNGKGIDWQALKKAAENKGLKPETKDDLTKCLFEDGVSTLTSVSETSGRGVGLAQLKSTVLALNGRISVESEIGHGTAFLFIFPKEKMNLNRTTVMEQVA